MSSITTITAYADNYIYLCRHDPGTAFVVDPAESPPVLGALESQKLSLSIALITHHHFDHVQGAQELKKRTGCPIIGPDKNRIPAIDRLVKDADLIELPKTTIRVIATPGHTATSVCYYVLPAKNRSGILFTGDTLFIGGCGRLLECDAQTMWDSLRKITALPPDTLVYPGHDYTEENYEFALTIEPDNDAVKKCLQQIKDQLKQADPAVPSTIAREKATNVFLRANTPEIKAALGMLNAPDAEAFAELRRRKDIFG